MLACTSEMLCGILCTCRIFCACAHSSNLQWKFCTIFHTQPRLSPPRECFLLLSKKASFYCVFDQKWIFEGKKSRVPLKQTRSWFFSLRWPEHCLVGSSGTTTKVWEAYSASFQPELHSHPKLRSTFLVEWNTSVNNLSTYDLPLFTNSTSNGNLPLTINSWQNPPYLLLHSKRPMPTGIHRVAFFAIFKLITE